MGHMRGFPKIRGTFFIMGACRIRSIVFGVYVGDPPSWETTISGPRSTCIGTPSVLKYIPYVLEAKSIKMAHESGNTISPSIKSPLSK